MEQSLINVSHYDETIDAQLKQNKLTDLDKTSSIKSCFYTDGGSKKDGVLLGGWGVHGYVFADAPTNSSSGCKKSTPTANGYKTGKVDSEHKVPVLLYLDAYGVAEEATNNKAELLAMLNCLKIIKEFNIVNAKIFADSQYVLKLLSNYQIYQSNGFKSSTGKELANQELCIELVNLYTECKNNATIELEWVEGHSGNFGNDCADNNATKALHLNYNKVNNIKLEFTGFLKDLHADSDIVINLASPQDYWQIERSPPKMLCENSLFFTTNGIDVLEPTVYYQASFGKKLASKDKDEKKSFRGKPFADCCISVVCLKEEEPVINSIIATTHGNFHDTGVIECDLSYISREAVYNDIASGGLYSSRVDLTQNKIYMANKTELAVLINPVRLAFRLINDFNAVKNFLDKFRENDLRGINKIVDVTDLFYQTTETKGKKVTKTIEHETGYVNAKISFEINGKDITTEIPLTVAVDTPSKIGLGKMKTINPKVQLVIWEVTERSLRYATLIETDEGIGVWMGIFSNIHLY